MNTKTNVIQPPENSTGLAGAAGDASTQQSVAPKKKVRAKSKRRKPRKDKGIKRPRATQQTPQEKAETPLTSSEQRRDAAHANRDRPTRVAMNANYEKLGAIAKAYIRDGFHLRFFSDQPGRIGQALSAHYIFVVDDQGNQVVYQKGLRKMILMELPNHLWEDEKALMLAKTIDIVKAKQKVGEGQYVPDGQIQPLVTDPTSYDDE